jgi:hypothetical protein
MKSTHFDPPAIPALFFILVALASAFSCASSPGPQAGKQPIAFPEDFFGIAHAGYSRTGAELDLLSWLGVGFSRIDFSWDIIQPRPGAFDFSRYDGILTALASRGIGTLPILDYDVGWIHPDGRARRRVPPDRMDDWLAYVRGTVGHFRGKVIGWEIWNEPNWSFWSGSVDEFADLTRLTIKAIREVDPGTRILVGSFFRDPVGFARAMSRRGAFEGADVISFHPYDLSPEGSARLAANFMKELRSMGFGGEFWITEIGFPTEGLYPNRVRERDFPATLAKSVILLAVSGSSRIAWYSLSDRYMASGEGRDKSIIKNAEDYFGISYPDYSPKIGAWAYAAMTRIVRGSVFDPGAVVISGKADSVNVFPFRMRNGSVGIVAWADGVMGVESSSVLTGYRLALDGPGESPFSARRIELSTKPTILVLDRMTDLPIRLNP